MRWLSRWRIRLSSLVHRRSMEDEMEVELRTHLEEQIEHNLALGMSEEEARRQAQLAFGNLEALKDDCRDVRRFVWLETVVRDLRFGARHLRRSPGLVVTSALSLGLGIGLNLALYSSLDAIYRHRPTMRDPKSVVGVEPGNGSQLSYENLRDLDEGGPFETVVGFRTTAVTLRLDGRLERAGALAVTGNFFEGLGISAAQGRTFSAREAALEREPRLVVLSHDFWQVAFGGREVLGERLELDGEPFTIIGVLPDDYRPVTGFMGPSLYLPLSRLLLPAVDDRGSPSLTALARLQHGQTREVAQAATTAFHAGLESLDPERNEGLGQPAKLFSVADLALRGTPAGMRIFAVLLLIVFGLVLLIAAANVASLLLARSVRRRHEIAMHVALGAGRRRVMQALWIESLLLTGVGAVAGALLAWVASWLPPAGVLGLFQAAMRVDGSLLVYAVSLILTTSLLCGLVPVIRTTRGDLLAEIRHTGQTGTGRLWWRDAFVVGQVALSLSLLVIGALCLRSQLRIGGLDLGFDPDHGAVVYLLEEPGANGDADRIRVAERIVGRLEAVPGVRSASVANVVPLGGDSLVRSFHPAGRSDIPGTRASRYSVGPGYFDVLSIRLVRGREFEEGDDEGAPAVVIVNETYARTYFGGDNPIGQRVQSEDEPEAEVVGVVADHRIDTLGEAPKSVLFYPYAQRPRRPLFHVRTKSTPESAVPAIVDALADLEESAGLDVETLRSATDLEFSMRRVGTLMMGAVGGLGLLLASIGLYGVLSYLVASRTAEVGIRMALGASAPRVVRSVLGQALRIVGLGVVLGSLMALLMAPSLATFLAGLSPMDPLSFLGTAALLLVVALLASYLPARRAARVDPTTALRNV